MYLAKLIDLLRKIPEITNQNLDNIDNFLGNIGFHNIFSKNQFRSVITQKQYDDVILEWLVANKIIEPKYMLCPNCHKEIAYSDSVCDFCNHKIESSAEVDSYEIIQKLRVSQEEKEIIETKRLKLEKSCFELMLKRLSQKERRKEDSYIIFSDIASSTQLNEKYPLDGDVICRGVPKFLRELTIPFFRLAKGIYIKNEGDASYILLDSLTDVIQFMRSVYDTITLQSFYENIKRVNSDIEKKIKESSDKNKQEVLSNNFVFIKFYIAKSPTGKYTQTDMLSIDFDNTLKAIVFIKRIEKVVKTEIFSGKDLTKNIPFCIVSQSNDFNGKDEILKEEIQDYGTNVPVWYSEYNSIKSFFNIGDK